MPIPAQSDFYRPILDITSETDGGLTRKELTSKLLAQFPMTDDELYDLIPSGGQTRAVTRVNWAIYELKTAGLLDYPQNSWVQITEFGRIYLSDPPEKITYAGLKRLSPEDSKDSDLLEMRQTETDSVTPEEQLANSYKEQLGRLADEVLENVKGLSPNDFERLVNRLLSQMGYGEIARESGRSGDQGIDGILNQDTLGLEKVYVQAKRYSAGQVGEPEIRSFSGSLDPYGATKGIFMTTAVFSSSARQTAENISRGGKFIRLIEGKELAELMIQHGVGVVTEITYEVKKLDANYFADL